jgi:hypothetical protein
LDNSKEVSERLAKIENKLKMFREMANRGECSPEWVDGMEKAFRACKGGDITAAIKFLIVVMFGNGSGRYANKEPEETGGENGRIDQ